jgi:photosystem II stability/assembly factor-like uncharacterized protein
MKTLDRLTGAGLLTVALCALWAAFLAGGAFASVDYGSVSFVDQGNGWVAGIDNQSYMTEVWKTVDGGVSWIKVGSSIAAGAGVDWVAFVSPSTGVWGNGSVWRTTDGGAIWKPASTSAGIFNEASFAAADLGWAGCSYGTSESGGGVAVTADGGATWTRQLDRPGRDGSGGFSRVSSPTTSRCYALKWGRGGGVWATANGGAKWKLRLLPTIAGSYKFYRDIDFPAAKTGWAVGDSGQIVKTTDGGMTWKRQRSGVTSALAATDFVSVKVGFAVGSGGCILRTVDGGKHWVRLTSGTSKMLAAVCFVDESHGWVAGAKGALLRTTDGGKTWQSQH